MRAPMHSPLRTALLALVTWIGRGFALSALLIQIARERRALSRLSDAELSDIGISRDDAKRESRRSWFEIPANRLKRSAVTRRGRLNNSTLRRSSDAPKRSKGPVQKPLGHQPTEIVSSHSTKITNQNF